MKQYNRRTRPVLLVSVLKDEGPQVPALTGSLPAAPPLRLAGGRGRCEGRVEVWHRGQWGTVCDDLWSLRNARVVCRALRCGRALGAPGRSRFGPGEGPILLDRVRCAGTEDALERCAHRGWARHDCRHREDAGVVCAGTRGAGPPGALPFSPPRASPRSELGPRGLSGGQGGRA